MPDGAALTGYGGKPRGRHEELRASLHAKMDGVGLSAGEGGTGLALPHPLQDWAPPAHVRTGTAL